MPLQLKKLLVIDYLCIYLFNSKLMPLFLFLLTALLAVMSPARAQTACPLVPLQVERLPNLHTPRAGHATLCVGGEVVVMGGHTNGFVPTPTAEYFSDGQWHSLTMVYSHDQGLVVPMSDGRVLVAGGHAQDLGIGQLFSVELYHPRSHTFEGYGCLDQKRCFADGVELDSGRVVISGNWYADDAIECYQGERLFSPVKPVAQMRAQPCIFRTAPDDAIIFSPKDEHGQAIDTIIIDRVKGEPFTVPLFNQWRPLLRHMVFRSEESFVGDVDRQQYTYLLAVQNVEEQLAIARVHNGVAELLPTVCPIPMESQGDSISYITSVIADRHARKGYVMGIGHDNNRLYVLTIDYSQSPAPLTLGYCEPQDSIGLSTPVLTPQGNLLMAGGVTDSNFEPNNTVVLFCVGNPAEFQEATAERPSSLLWWLLLPIAVLLIAVAWWVLVRRRPSPKGTASEPLPTVPQPVTTASVATEGTVSVDMFDSEELMNSIALLMEKEKVYQNSKLKLQDVADRLSTNRTYIADCIKAAKGVSFPTFVNAYRVEHAKQLLSMHHDMKISTVGRESGFSSDASFFRLFKSYTGMTPKEWVAFSRS